MDLGGRPLAGVGVGRWLLPHASLLHVLAVDCVWIQVCGRIGKDKLVVAFGIHEDEEPMNLGGRCVQSVGVCTEPAEDLLTHTHTHMLQPASKPEMDMRRALASI